MRRLLPLVVIAAPAFAHQQVNESSAEVWRALTGIALLVMTVLYLTGLRHVWGHTIRGWQAAAFAGGVASAAAALLSPLDRWSDVLFSAHMAQHEILMLISAPLMVLGRPFIPTLWAFPAGAREKIGRTLHRRWALKIWDRLTGPLTVLIMHAVVLWMWHVPALFEAALQNESIHAVQHLGFFLTAALFWWALVHGRYGRIGYGAGVFYVFATAMHTEILGALLTFGNRIWYPTHAARTIAAGMSPIDDQQFAGILMWVPFGAVFVFVGLALFAAWLGEAERRVAFTSAERAREGRA